MGGRGSSWSDRNSAGADRVSRLKGGATLRMKNPETGMSFNVHAKSFAGLTGYKITNAIRADGSKAPGRSKGPIMSTSEASSWLGGLKEVK
jgi:hypothetical protein